MTPACRAAILDAILPGETRGPDGKAALPPASTLSAVTFPSDARASDLFQAIAAQAGGSEGFLALNAAGRARCLAEVERMDSAAFKAFITELLIAYYEAPPVLAAMGWRAAPPQPLGHDVPDLDEATERRLARIAAREPFWRAPS